MLDRNPIGKLILSAFILLIPHFVWADGGRGGSLSGEQLFIPNGGQWHGNVKFKSRVPGGSFFLEEAGFTYLRVDQRKLHELHHEPSGQKENGPAARVDAHAVKVRLLGAQRPSFKREDRSDYYENHYRSKDPENWAGKLHAHRTVTLEGIYEGTDMQFERTPQGIKYSFALKSGEEASRIRLQYRGQKGLKISESGGLLIKTRFGHIKENAPKAFQSIGGEKVEVPCEFELEGDIVSFRFPEGYRKGHALIIDPNVIFSSYTGSTSDNWGNTATYDDDGALYAGGTVFGSSYPTTTGAYQLSFGGGGGGLGCDVAISKFSPDGTSLQYSTYLGGSANEVPHSLVVNDLGQLFVLGSTGSNDFPTSATAASPTFMGGTNVTAFGSIQFSSGTDAFISKFASDGSSLLGSTYLGGSGNDGLNEASNLNHNYGDILRGEVEVDDTGNCYVVSTTYSTDLPTTASSFQDSLAGNQDAFITKLSPDLSNYIYCSYYGGSSNDAGYAIELSPQGVYMSGGTESSDLPAPSGWQTSSQGGVDGYVVRFNDSISSVLDASYIGTSSYDQAYFVGRDTSDNILLYGQSNGTYPVHNVSYSDPNSGQFIEKLPPDLSSSLLSTVFGTGSGSVDISPSAFMVSSCNNIYLSGWGGSVNQGHGVSGSSTNGLPTTPSAYQSSTDGSDFYLMVLGSNASSLKYASFFGGGVSDEHVDGGTSRFDENGIVYQAVCGGCGGNSDFPTTAGAHSQTNNSLNCNLAAFKFDMSQLTASINAQDPPTACQADTFTFEFNGTGGNSFVWNYGDGTSDTGTTVTHLFSDTGTYQVELIVQDTSTCNEADTATTTVHIYPPNSPSVDSVDPICPGDSIQLNANGGFAYQWSPDSTLNDPTTQDPYSYPDSTTEYQLITQGCDQDSTLVKDTLYVTVPIAEITSTAMEDTTICPGDSVYLNTSGGGASFNWSPDSSLIDPTISSPLAFPSDTTTYEVQIIDTNGCETLDSVTVRFHEDFIVNTSPDTFLCVGESTQLHASGGSDYQWSPPLGLSDPSTQDPIASPSSSIQYEVLVTDSNGCTNTGSIELTVDTIPPQPSTTPDTAICEGEHIQLRTNGGYFYNWYPDTGLDSSNISNPTVSPPHTMTYFVEILNGCGTTSDSVKVRINDPLTNAGPDTLLCSEGDSLRLYASGGESYEWYPRGGLQDPMDSTTMADVHNSTDFKVIGRDSIGCVDTGTVRVEVYEDPVLSAGKNLKVEWGSRTVLTATGASGDYFWHPPESFDDPDNRSVSFNPEADGVFWVELTDEHGCSSVDSVRIEVSGSLYAPNAFSPDGDGINEVWRPKGSKIRNYHLQIFDRWGELVFESRKLENGWNGKVDGHPAKPDVYVYRIAYSEEYRPSEMKEKVGQVTLIR